MTDQKLVIVGRGVYGEVDLGGFLALRKHCINRRVEVEH